MTNNPNDKQGQSHQSLLSDCDRSPYNYYNKVRSLFLRMRSLGLQLLQERAIALFLRVRSNLEYFYI